jgi:hypothetical protein
MVSYRVVPPKFCEMAAINKEVLWITNFNHTVLKLCYFIPLLSEPPKEENKKSN